MSTTPASLPQNGSFKREQVIEIIGSVMQRMSHSHQVMDDTLVLELHALKDVIDALKQELHQAHPIGIQNHIPGASNELEAIVQMTESATNTIMNACENIQNILQTVPYMERHTVEIEIIRMVEACTFQDITGQRISKITKALSAIDARATELAEILEKNFAAPNTAPPPAGAPISLMNGPQLPGQGISQEDIDALLNDMF
jgi:chemotaxis protein CheZ